MQLLEVTARSGLTIRRFPSAEADRIVAMPLGMRVERLDDQTWNDRWYRIRAHFSGDYIAEGYSASAYLRALTPPAEPEEEPETVAGPVISSLHPLTPPGTARRHVGELHQVFAGQVSALLEACKKKGLRFKLFEAYRTPQRQAHLFAQGRSRPGSIVTNAEAWRSIHNYGLAADLILDIPATDPWETGSVNGVNYMTHWERMRKLAKTCGLNILSWDLPHVEMSGTSWRALAKGELPPGGGPDWADNLERMIREFGDAGALDSDAMVTSLRMQRNAVSGGATTQHEASHAEPQPSLA